MSGDSDGAPIGSNTKQYDSSGHDSILSYHISFLKRINPFNNNQSTKSGSSNASSSGSETSETEEAYRGVQGLKHFWNSRISAIKEPKQKAATLSGAYIVGQKDQCNLTGSKSIQCLSNDTAKRSLSFCDSAVDLLSENKNRTNIDNFYKYKTASSKKRSSFSAASDLKKLNSFGVNFPLVASTSKGEKIHWARRDDIFTNRKQKDPKNYERKTIEVSPKYFAIVKDNVEQSSRISNNINVNEMAIKSTDKRDSARSQSGSTNSLSSESPVRKSSSAPRKYSFKTHSKNYHSPRKMTSGSGGSTVAALTHRFNQLIQQDAAILKEVKRNNGILMSTAGHVYKIKDGSESSRKKTIKSSSGTDEELSSVKGSGGKKLSFKKKPSPPTKQPKVSKDGPMTVKAAIAKFETNGLSSSANATNSSPSKQSLQKPKIPSKSEYVLQRTKEVALRNSLRKNKLHISTAEIRVSTSHKVLAEIKEEEKPLPQVTTTKTDDTFVPLQVEEPVQPIEISVVQGEPPSTTSTTTPSVTPPGSPESDDNQSKKSKYARIYEKFRCRPHFTCKKSPLIFTNTSPKKIQGAPDQKIVDALETVNKKLEHLSKSTSDISHFNEEDRLYQQMTANMKPNESFLFRNNSKINTSFMEASGDSEPQRLAEAVNTRLINKTQSMDETKFPSMNLRQISFEEHEYPTIFQETDKLLTSLKRSHQIDELYEPISPPDENCQEADIPKIEEVKEVSSTEEENIYQTLTEVKNFINRKDCDSINSYESYANYESVEDDLKIEISENSYEICDPPEPPPPRKSETDNTRINSEQLPAIPVPKRILPNGNLLPNVDSSRIPPRPPKSPRSNSSNDRSQLPEIPLCLFGANFDSEDELNNDGDDENIYDTIKHSRMLSHCYESITSKNQPKSLDSVSMVSNCYESITSLRRMAVLQHSDSISTLSSDQKTNSLYGMTLGQNATPPSEGASDNSEDWVTDLSDDETSTLGGVKHQFIVVRERAKCHRSPDWSKKVRDRRIHRQSENLDGDDSDHLYEPLYNIRHSDQNLSPESQRNGTNNGSIMANNNCLQNNNSGNCYSDEYDDSFSDEETDEDVKKNDSGVDISNVRLPDPPPTTNQVYAFVKKIKNLGSLSKSLSKISIRKSIPTSKTPPTPNKYENTQFHDGHEYQNTNFDSQKSAKLKTPRTPKKSLKLPKTPDDPYENTEFHSPRTPTIIIAQTPEAQSSPLLTPTPLSHSDRSLSEIPVSPEPIVSRKKSKSGKSFKSKFRKSMPGPEPTLTVPNAFNGTRSTFYISDSVDVDSGIFEKTTLNSEPNLSQTTNELQSTDKSATIVRKTKKSLSSPELNRRKTTIGIRPSNPPPPPPVDKKIQKQKHVSTTSWYTECGVFKANNIGEELLLKDARHDRNSNTSWYADAGLYQTSGASVASSSGSSGVSTGGEGGPGDDNSHSMFLNEPLYQIYSAAKLESITDIEDQESTDGYEEIGTHRSSMETRKSKRPSAFQLIGPRQGPSRTLWSEIPEVQNSDLLSTLSPVEKRLQEAKFEILTSEASYLKSLNLLKKHFMGHPAFRDTNILSGSDRKTLFSSILPVQECSDRLLCDLENCWQDNIMLLGLSKSIYKHAEKYFHVYVSFCENQGKMDRTLRRLKETKGTFNQHLDALESESECCGLNLHSFLMLPMQRITRLPLLIDAVFSKLRPDDDEYEDWKMTLGILNKIVSQCNDAANRCEQAYEIERISRQIEFPSNIRSLAIAPVGIPTPGKKPRFLVKKGELVQLIWRGDDAKLTFGKKFIKCNIFVFLFTDLLVLTKRKGDELFVAFDYCPRSMLTVSSGEVIPQLPTKEIVQAGKNLILMTLLENHECKTTELILSCSSVSEQQRWLEATKPPESENPDETLYEQWDCPQVIVKHEFDATEPDLLSLQLGDVINVNRKMTDGWYQGERIRDGAAGWFPGNFTEEVNSPHVRARNLKQRYRLLTLTASYLESQKKK